MDSSNSNYSNDDSSDDDAPEEVSTKVSSLEAKKILNDEKTVKTALKRKLKEKRRQEVERNVQQKKIKNDKLSDIDRLPTELIDEIESDLLQIQTKTLNKNQEKIESSVLPEKQIKKKRKPIKSLTTVSTEYKVMDMKEIQKIKVPIAQTNACEFRQRMLFNSKRNKRIHSGKFQANKLKRFARCS